MICFYKNLISLTYSEFVVTCNFRVNFFFFGSIYHSLSFTFDAFGTNIVGFFYDAYYYWKKFFLKSFLSSDQHVLAQFSDIGNCQCTDEKKKTPVSQKF
jgi:hypothetical protein